MTYKKTASILTIFISLGLAGFSAAAGVINESKIITQAKFGLAIEKWITENEIDAAAIQCWESIQKNYGCATCLSMSMLGEKLIPCACEVDVAGVVSMGDEVSAS